jgi:hypothetical protein
MKSSGWSLKRNILVEEDQHVRHQYLAEQLAATITRIPTRFRLKDRVLSMAWPGRGRVFSDP